MEQSSTFSTRVGATRTTPVLPCTSKRCVGTRMVQMTQHPGFPGRISPHHIRAIQYATVLLKLRVDCSLFRIHCLWYVLQPGPPLSRDAQHHPCSQCLGIYFAMFVDHLGVIFRNRGLSTNPYLVLVTTILFALVTTVCVDSCKAQHNQEFRSFTSSDFPIT